jgi:hypothetical protein
MRLRNKIGLKLATYTLAYQISYYFGLKVDVWLPVSQKNFDFSVITAKECFIFGGIKKDYLTKAGHDFS